MRIGIDLGGTKIEGIAIADDGVERLRRRIAAPRGSYADTLEAVTGMVHTIERELGVAGTVGIGTPGTISPATGRIKNSNSTWLNGTPLHEDLSRMLGRHLRFANDANCFALSEAIDGAAAGAPVVFGVIVGTGTGGGVVVNQRVVTGANAIAGEWGHNPLPAARDGEMPGPACYCGRHGCIETFLSGPALARDYEAGGGSPSGPTAVTAEQVAALAASGDPLAHAALERYEERLARALGSIINVLDPDVVVLGGGLSNIDRLYDRVPTLWSAYVFSDRVTTRLVRAAHGDSSGVRGAAWLWNSE
jgi:predicted NBD/HSP70 family sugar kinase